MRIATNPVWATMMSASGGWFKSIDWRTRRNTSSHIVMPLALATMTLVPRRLGVQPSVSHRRQRFHDGGQFLTGLMG